MTASWSTSFGSASLSAMQVYEEVMVPRIFTPWARVLLDELALDPGEVVLDVACGPGSVTRLAAAQVGPTGRVTGCDLSPAMLDIAQAKLAVPGGGPIDYRQAPADQLPVSDGAFDVVVCQQGLQFFPDRPAALAEMRRALRPSGRLGIAVWCPIEQSPLFAALAAAVGEVAGDEIANRLTGPFGLASAEELRALIEEAGFTTIGVARHVLPVTFEGGAAQVASILAATPIASALGALSAEQKEQLGDTLERKVEAFIVDGALHSEMASNLAFARR